MTTLCTRAMKLFRKTRSSASKNSIREARKLDQDCVHQLFADEHDPSLDNVLNMIKQYRPKQSYLELKNDQNQIQLSKNAVEFIKYAKKAALKHKEKEKNKKARQEEEKLTLEDMYNDDSDNSLDDQNGAGHSDDGEEFEGKRNKLNDIAEDDDEDEYVVEEFGE